MLDPIWSARCTSGPAPQQCSVQSRHGARRGEGGAVAQLLVELPFVALEAGRVAMCSAQACSLHPALLDRLPKVPRPPLFRASKSVSLAKGHFPLHACALAHAADSAMLRAVRRTVVSPQLQIHSDAAAFL